MEKCLETQKIYLLDDNDTEIEIPGRFITCPRCEGRGSHVNPSIDEHGLSREDFDEMGPDFEEDYFSGVYDVQCHECKGLRVILEVDEDRATEEQIKLYWDEIHEEIEYNRTCAMERRMGA